MIPEEYTYALFFNIQIVFFFTSNITKFVKRNRNEITKKNIKCMMCERECNNVGDYKA